MKLKLALALSLAFAMPLPGCATVPAPAELANKTIADEKAAIALELAYTSASKAGTALVRAGFVDPVRFAKLDARAYNALLVARNAYRAGNSASYIRATAELNAALDEVNKLLDRVP